MANNLPYSQQMADNAYQTLRQDNADYYKSNMAYLGQQFELEQARRLAEIGAQDLAKYGPEGQQWAEHLLRDPYAAIKMAELQGGFGAITSRLRYADAVQRATTDEERLRAAGEAYGLPEQIDLMEAQAALAENGEGKVYGTSKGQRPFRVVNGQIEYLPGFDQQQAASEVDPRFFRPDAQGIIRDVRTGLPAFPNQSPIDAARWTDVRTPRDAKIKEYETIAKSAELLDTANPSDPAWQRAVIVLNQKLIDASAVMQGEAEATGAAVRDQAGKIANRLQMILTGQAEPLKPEEIQLVINQGKQMAAVVLAHADRELMNWDRENARLGGVKGDPLVEYATPREWVDRVRRAGSAMAPSLTPPPPTLTPESHEAAKQALRDKGIPDEFITPEMVLDLVESAQGEDAPGAQEAPVPVTGPLTPAEIIRAQQAAAQRRANGGR